MEKPVVVEDIGDWKARFRTRAAKGWRKRDDRPTMRKVLPGGVSCKIQEAIDWYGEDWCGIKPPRPRRK